MSKITQDIMSEGIQIYLIKINGTDSFFIENKEHIGKVIDSVATHEIDRLREIYPEPRYKILRETSQDGKIKIYYQELGQYFFNGKPVRAVTIESKPVIQGVLIR